MRKALLVWVVVLTWNHRARADDLPIINITEQGPQQAFPSDKSFYVQGDAGKNTSWMQVAIVRIADAWLWNSVRDAESCAAVATSLDVTHPREEPHDPGLVTASVVFPHATQHNDDQVLLSSTWAGSATDPAHFKVLVSNDSKFISAGASYCIYILASTQQIDDKTIRNTLQRLADDYQVCEQDTGDHARCRARFFEEYQSRLDDALGEQLPEGTPVPSCLNDPLSAALTRARADMLLPAMPVPAAAPQTGARPAPAVPPVATPSQAVARRRADHKTQYCTLREHALAAGNHAFAMFDKRHELIRALRGLPRFTLPLGWLSTDHEVGHALAIALARHGAIVANRARRGGVEYRTLDQALHVAAVKILDDDLTVQVADLVKGRYVGARTLSGVTASDLVIAPGIKLSDLLALGEGTIHTPGDDRSFDALATLLGSLTLASSLDAATDSALKAFASKMYALDALSERLRGPPPEPESLAQTTAEIHDWLATIRFDDPDVVDKLHAIAWLATTQFDDTNMADKYHVLAPLLIQINAARHGFESDRDGLQIQTGEVVSLVGPKVLPLKIALNETSWAFSFLAPMIGYAALDGRNSDGWFAMYYTGVQLHLFANPAADPLWSHGASEDWKRAFAIEVGAGLKSAGFGPGNRYTGPLGLVPITIGAAFHVVPYTSVTLGAVLFNRRDTVLPADKGNFTPAFFVGLNVVPNLPDLLKQYSGVPAVVK